VPDAAIVRLDVIADDRLAALRMGIVERVPRHWQVGVDGQIADNPRLVVEVEVREAASGALDRSDRVTLEILRGAQHMSAPSRPRRTVRVERSGPRSGKDRHDAPTKDFDAALVGARRER